MVVAAQRPARVIGPGYRIQAELDERGWTQKDLAEVLGRPIQAVNEMEDPAKWEREIRQDRPLPDREM